MPGPIGTPLDYGYVAPGEPGRKEYLKSTKQPQRDGPPGDSPEFSAYCSAKTSPLSGLKVPKADKPPCGSLPRGRELIERAAIDRSHEPDPQAEFDRFEISRDFGQRKDPSIGLMRYRGSAGPGTITFSYDPDTEHVVNGSVRPIDMCR